MKIISAIFAGSMIRKGFGKLRAPSLVMLIKRLIKVGARVSYHARRWHIHVALAFPWLTITERCWPGVPELYSFEASRF